MTDISLIKEAAARIYNIKTANVGYENGYLYELGDAIAEPMPGIVKKPLRAAGSFIYNHPKAIIGTALAAYGGNYLWKKYKKYKADQEAKKRSLPKQVPVDVMVGTPENQIPEDVLAKESSYNKVNKVLNWIYS